MLLTLLEDLVVLEFFTTCFPCTRSVDSSAQIVGVCSAYENGCVSLAVTCCLVDKHKVDAWCDVLILGVNGNGFFQWRRQAPSCACSQFVIQGVLPKRLQKVDYNPCIFV